ncbi:hypothetical protein Syun_004168 [Stephania yunnanensis]|uniref:Transposase n=1 Tax=Stephania yunnanensis TaxID=152371 RepID=A0AAP0L2M3_9MAGN
MELSSEALQPLNENAMIPLRSLWNEGAEFQKGMRFMCKVDIQHAVKLYSIREHRRFVVAHSTPNVWIVRCKKYVDGCTWRLRCSRRKSHGMFEISKYARPHTCIYANLSKDHVHLDSTVICREVENVVRRDPSISVPVLHQMIKDKYSYDVRYKKVWLGKKKAIAKVYGDWEESYKILPRWMAALQETNPGTRVEWRHGEPNANNEVIFKWVFWAFEPSIAGFKHCRPMIQIDGTFLYGKYKHKLLIATVVDSNSHVFPLAFAIVDEESQHGWGWFMACLRHHVTDRDGICVISDRHPGILLAMNNPQNGWTRERAHHRFCLRHICSNFNMRFGSKELKDMVYLAGAQHQPRKFKAVMTELQEMNAECIAWFNNLDRAQWTNAYDKGYRYG